MANISDSEFESADSLRRSIMARTRLVRLGFWFSLLLLLLVVWGYFFYGARRIAVTEAAAANGALVASVLVDSGLVTAGLTDPVALKAELGRLSDEIRALRANAATSECRGDSEDSRLQVATIRFGIRQAELDNVAAKGIREAAERVRRAGATTVFVLGHADSVGSDSLNYGLSKERARVVAAALSSELGTTVQVREQHYGERRLLTLTGDGAPSQDNRAVTIVVERRPTS
jgi:outer membrane protein OmpA-like peptidoglycan-associated protein